MSSAIDVDVTALAAGGDGVARDERPRDVRAAHGARRSRARAARRSRRSRSRAASSSRSLHAVARSRRAAVRALHAPAAAAARGSTSRAPAQLAAKQAIVTGALRKLGVAVEPIADPCPPYGWRRRARFHVAGGKRRPLREGTHDVLPIDAALPAARARSSMRRSSGPRSRRARRPTASSRWRSATRRDRRRRRAAVEARGRARRQGRRSSACIAGETAHGKTRIELEPGLIGGPWDFAQASAAGNAR